MGDALDRDHVELDFTSFSHMIPSTTVPTTHSPPLKFRFKQNFSGFGQTGLAVWQGSISLFIALLRATAAREQQEQEKHGAAKDINHSDLRQDLVFDVPQFRGARILELGTGLGVLSVLVSALLAPAEVLATDGDSETVRAASANVAENLVPAAKVSALQLRWGSEEDIELALLSGSS